MKKNLHLYQSPFRSESRILRETKTIVDSGFIDKVVIAAVWENGLHLKEKLDDKSPLVRAMAIWALAQLLDPKIFNEVRENNFAAEQDLTVKEEWSFSNQTFYS